MKANSILIAGQSHTFALGVKPVMPSPELVEVSNGRLPIYGISGEWPRNEAYWDRVVAESAGRIVMLLLYGGQHYQHFLMVPAHPFDFLLASEPDLPIDGSCEIVPQSALLEFLYYVIDEVEDLLPRIRAAGGLPVLCATPPPKADQDFIRRAMTHEVSIRELADELGIDMATVALNPPLRIYKIWAAMQLINRRIAEKHDIPYLPVPGEAVTDEGFLKPLYYGIDVIHANAAYGALVRAQMQDFAAHHV